MAGRRLAGRRRLLRALGPEDTDVLRRYLSGPIDGLVFFFNGDRGRAVLGEVIRAGHGVQQVYVPRCRVRTDRTAECCRRLGVRMATTGNVNAPEFVSELISINPRLLVIAGYSTVFRRSLLDAAKLGAINLHAGRLPEYRGGSPLNWQIINGEPEAGICVIQADEGIDTGDVLAETSIPIAPDDTITDLHRRANELFPTLVLDVLTALDAGDVARRVQDESRAGYWHQRNDGDGRIRWSTSTARQVRDLVRAVTRPYPGAFFEHDGRRIRVWRTGSADFGLRGVPGRVCYMRGQGPYVICTDGAVLLQEVTDDAGSPVRLDRGIHLC